MHRRSDTLRQQRGAARTSILVGIAGLLLVATAWYVGVDPRALLGLTPPVAPPAVPTVFVDQAQVPAPRDEIGDFISVVLADTEDTWTQIFAEEGDTYIPPRLRYFEGSTRSACGTASAEAGPFYCPTDRRVYIDLAFYRALAERFHAPGDFAQAYVIAHEVGHHVQNLTGIQTRVRKQQDGLGKLARTALKVKLELQADCYAGIWAHNADRARHIVEKGDLDETLRAAAAVGEDLIQHRGQGEIVPDPFLHGTAAQRKHWFQAGFKRGLVKDCDTFKRPPAPPAPALMPAPTPHSEPPSTPPSP
jgi:predicted metalloprotease